MNKLSNLPAIASGALLGVCFFIFASPVRGQVFNHSPPIAWSGAALMAARAQSSRTTLYNLVMTGNQPESLGADSFGSNAKCSQAQDVATENLIFLGVNDQTKRQVYIWCDVPKAARRSKRNR